MREFTSTLSKMVVDLSLDGPGNSFRMAQVVQTKTGQDLEFALPGGAFLLNGKDRDLGNGILGRVIHSDDKETTVLWTVPAGRGTPAHDHEEHEEQFIVLRGDLTIEVEQEDGTTVTHELAAGKNNTVAIPPAMSHCGASTEFSLIAGTFRPPLQQVS